MLYGTFGAPPHPNPLPNGERGLVRAPTSNLVRDEQRTAFLGQRGFRVLRFGNRDVMTSIDVVLDTILAAFGGTPPTPAPPREEEGIGNLR